MAEGYSVVQAFRDISRTPVLVGLVILLAVLCAVWIWVRHRKQTMASDSGAKGNRRGYAEKNGRRRAEKSGTTKKK